mgnify:CR=1 FL=1
MKRYDNTTIKKSTSKRHRDMHHRNTTFYSAIPETDDDIYVITQLGDRLDNLAFQFYGDVTLWWYIAKANGLKDLRVDSGISLRIPGSTRYATGR